MRKSTTLIIILVLLVKLVSAQDASTEIVNTDNTVFMDTFKVDNSTFSYHIKVDSSDGGFEFGKLTVKQFQNKQWKTMFSYDYSDRTSKVLLDVNNDGFLDIVNNWKWFSENYLFNKETKTFDTIPLGLSNDWELLDAANNIFCDQTEVKDILESSHLYTFNQGKLTILYSIKFKSKRVKNEDFPVVYKMELYKGNFESKPSHPTLISSINISPNYNFDYNVYWKKKYKELLGYR